MTTEAKVGAFIIAGLVFLGVAIFLLGDFTFQSRYTLYVTFHDVAGLSEKAPVKLSGVEVGKIRGIDLLGDLARVEASISSKVPVYRDAVFSIGSTGIIGSKFLQIDQGRPETGTIPPKTTVQGQDPVSIEKAITKALHSLQELLGGGPGDKGTLAKNLNATVANVRNLTANLDELVADTKPQITSALGRLDSITAKLDSVLAKTNEMMAAINQSKGPVGALLHDEKMKNDVKETMSSLKEAAGTAKDVLGRMTQFRVYWNYDWRYEHAIRASRTDLGLKISPREGRYYYLGGSNIANTSDEPRAGDFTKKNTVDAMLGWTGDTIGTRWDLGIGVIRSGGGARVTLTPAAEHPVWGRFSVTAQAYDFGRSRTVNGHKYTKPAYDVGAQVRLHRVVGVGARVEDLSDTKRGQTWVNVSFEDKDIAYLFGMVTFGAAGTRGRSKSR